LTIEDNRQLSKNTIMLKTFRIGGIHPPENKLTAGKKIVDLALPKQVIIPLGQHIGAPAQPIVNKGDTVKVGTLIAKAGGFVSANIHSSVSGKVNKIDVAIDASGYRKPAVFIDVIGDDWEDTIDRSDTLVKECNLSSKEIIDKIAAAGVVGMGGAQFPTQVKLLPPPGNKAELVIINGVECEPYLTADHSLMLEKSEEILVGVTILMKAVNVKKAVIGIENNKKDAIAKLTKLAASYPGIEIQPLQMKYPQGGEKQLIDAIIRRQVKSGALPISTGAVVQNVGTCFAIYEAVIKNKPLIERVVTVTGKAVKNASNFRVRIGTQISELIEAAGGVPENTGKIISGGPMMGKALVNTEVPITKGGSGVLLINKNESKRQPMHECIRCAKCVNACPMGLNPTLLMNATEFGNWELAEKNFITDCIECGSCSYTCPAYRPLLDNIRYGKAKVSAIIRARKK
jgi:electron transport complex protein RnfC